MILLAIPAFALVLGFLGVRPSQRTYVVLGAVGGIICYIAYTR